MSGDRFRAGFSRCPTCDEWYDPKGDRAKVHEHPEPQGGAPRQAFMKSGLRYDKWILVAKEGRHWAQKRKKAR